MNEIKPQWEVEFDKEFCHVDFTSDSKWEDCKAFISNLLKTRDEQLIKKIEGLKYTEDQGIDAEMQSANRAYDQILNIIKE